MKTVIELIHNLYQIRSCKQNLSPDNIKHGKCKLCLEYHIKRCKGYCEGLASEEEYMKNIEEIKHILKGEIEIIEEHIEKEMAKA